MRVPPLRSSLLLARTAGGKTSLGKAGTVPAAVERRDCSAGRGWRSPGRVMSPGTGGILLASLLLLQGLCKHAPPR